MPNNPFARVAHRYLSKFGFFNKSLKTRFTLTGLILAQGAPLGYFLLKNIILPSDPNPIKHTLELIQHETWVSFYMWAGTTFFFTVFGRALGMKADQLRSSNEYLQHALVQRQSFELMRKKFMLNLMDQIRTPISLALEFLRGHSVGFWGIPESKQKELANITTEELSRLDESLKSMLEFKNLRQLGLENRVQASLSELVANSFNAFKKSHSGREMKFVDNHTDGTLGLINRELMVLAFEHLLKNALQYSPSAPITVHLKKTTGKNLAKDIAASPYCEKLDIEDSFFVICVEDKGPGIKESLVQQVFEPFVGAYLFDDQKNSLGLGLTLVREIAEWHGGVAWIESKHNEGTKATIVVPIKISVVSDTRAA